jgi:hypothetical protein
VPALCGYIASRLARTGTRPGRLKHGVVVMWSILWLDLRNLDAGHYTTWSCLRQQDGTACLMACAPSNFSHFIAQRCSADFCWRAYLKIMVSSLSDRLPRSSTGIDLIPFACCSRTWLCNLLFLAFASWPLVMNRPMSLLRLTLHIILS